MIARALIAVVALAGCTSAPPAALPFGSDAPSCGTCHEAQYDAWSSSPHATSGTSPVFEALRAEAEVAWGEAAADACVGCHQPGHSADVGVGCVSCHAATGNTGERDGRLRVDTDVPLAGPTGAGDNGAHATRVTGFLTSPSLCGTCHEVTRPALLDEPTLTEHLASDFATDGVGCVDCHMPDGEHRFIGIDPVWGADPATRRRAVDDARALFADAVVLTVEIDGTDAIVTIANVGAGHSVPTGAAFLRDVWLDVSFDGGDPVRVASFGAEMTHGDASVAVITRADAVESRSLSAGEVRTWSVPAPSGARRVDATLRLRAIRWDTLAALGLDDLREEVPTIDVTSQGASIP